MLAVWEEHFLFLRKRGEARQAAAVILHLGGPYEGSPSDKVWQDWALKACVAHGISVFYDGLNPRSGIGGESPFTPIEAALAANPKLSAALGRAESANNTGGLFVASWGAMHTAKLHAVGQVPATRVASVLLASSPPPVQWSRDDDQPGLYENEHTSFELPIVPTSLALPPLDEDVPTSPPAIVLATLVLLTLAGQLGCFRRLGTPLRARLDAAYGPGACGLLWAILGVPALPSPELGVPTPLPRAKEKSSAPTSRRGTARHGSTRTTSLAEMEVLVDDAEEPEANGKQTRRKDKPPKQTTHGVGGRPAKDAKEQRKLIPEVGRQVKDARGKAGRGDERQRLPASKPAAAAQYSSSDEEPPMRRRAGR